MAVPDLNPLRDKIQFGRKLDSQAPFQYASLDSFQPRPLIARWATLRDACIGRERAINPIPPNATPLDEAFIRQEIAFGSEAEAKVSERVVSLYQQKLTYGDFAQCRYAIGKAAVDAGGQYREARVLQDQERQLQARQIAGQQFANSVNAWANYMQAVNTNCNQAACGRPTDNPRSEPGAVP
jgi:hypothetical protein